MLRGAAEHVPRMVTPSPVSTEVTVARCRRRAVNGAARPMQIVHLALRAYDVPGA